MSPNEVPFGGNARYTIAIRHPKTDTYSLPSDVDLAPFELTSADKSRQVAGDEATTIFTLTLAVFHLEEKKIPDLLLQVEGLAGVRSLVVPGPPVKGVSGLPEDAKLRDIRGPATVRVPRWWPLLLAAAALLLLASAALAVRYLRNRPPEVHFAPPEPAHERALRELAVLRAEDLVGKGRKKEMFFRMSEIVRRYFGERFSFNAVDLTTPELLSALRKLDAPGLDYGECRRFSEESDLVKFAKFDPDDAACQAALDIARRFVQRTMPPAAGEQAPAKAQAA